MGLAKERYIVSFLKPNGKRVLRDCRVLEDHSVAFPEIKGFLMFENHVFVFDEGMNPESFPEDVFSPDIVGERRDNGK